MRDIIHMACGDCKRRNYSTTKNKRKTTERLEMSKYLPLLSEAHGAQRDEVGACGSRLRAASGRAFSATSHLKPEALKP